MHPLGVGLYVGKVKVCEASVFGLIKYVIVEGIELVTKLIDFVHFIVT